MNSVRLPLDTAFQLLGINRSPCSCTIAYRFTAEWYDRVHRLPEEEKYTLSDELFPVTRHFLGGHFPKRATMRSGGYVCP